MPNGDDDQKPKADKDERTPAEGTDDVRELREKLKEELKKPRD